MLFGKKTKGFCVDIGDQAVLVARLSQDSTPLVIEEVKEFSPREEEALNNHLTTTEGRGPTGYVHAKVAIYPPRRLVRRHTMDLKRIKDPAYLSEILSQQFRVEADKYTTQLLNPADGEEFDNAKGAEKEVLICGLPSEEILSLQDRLLMLGIYPQTLEIGTVATLGALVNYQKFKENKTPMLLLEMNEESTQSFIISADGVDVSRPIASGTAAMIPIVQKELGLKDEESARKLFYSNTFDFTGMGQVLIRRLLKELQSSIGFYEVQTGQSIANLFCTQLPPNLSWLSSTMGQALGVAPLKLDLVPWAESLGIRFASGLTPDERWLGLIALIASHQNVPVADQKA